ncbi:MAG TPA: NAD(P)-dependent oxidoreductase [Mycobacterium sp.]|nr:NAD(P)-dependent oxidoreductase [Mycobacterium sp.]
MRVLVAGATSVPGMPVLRELAVRGHEVLGLTRNPAKKAEIESTGAIARVVDVFDAPGIAFALDDFAPEAVVSLLTTLPKRGPLRYRDFRPARRLWSEGAGNLLAAAQHAGVRRFVAESVIFGYGYGPDGPPLIDESDLYPKPPPEGGEAMLAAMRGMERLVLGSGEHSGTEGIVLRYGFFYGDEVPHIQMMRRMAKWRLLPVPTGNSMLSWIHIDDVARATADAVERGRGGELYNIVDDHPSSFGDFVRSLPGPRPLTVPRGLFALVAPYAAIAMGNTWLPLSNAKAKAELGWTPVTRP